jgi:hypothetical protein
VLGPWSFKKRGTESTFESREEHREVPSSEDYISMNEGRWRGTRGYHFDIDLTLLVILRRTRIIPYVMTWDGVVTNFHRRYRNDLGITPTIEAYRQSQVLETTLEAISFEKRRGILDGYTRDDETHNAVERLGTAAMGTTEA